MQCAYKALQFENNILIYNTSNEFANDNVNLLTGKRKGGGKQNEHNIVV